MKRLFDIIFSLLGIIFLALPMLIIVIIIRIDSKGRAVFSQTRVGLHKKPFKIYKFRTMCVETPKNIPTRDLENPQEWMTKVGRFLRRTSIDEIPQLLNILKGDMSIVGPRPERVEHIRAYCERLPEFAYRFKVKGGLTGYAQIYGRYDTPPYQKLRLDLFYIENHSFLLDIKLILLTARAVFKKRMQ